MSLFLDALAAGGIHLNLPAADKETFLRDAIALLELPPNISRERVVKNILSREELGSTGIGRGIAVPHAMIPELGRTMMAVLAPSEPMDFDSLDGQPVSLLFLILSHEPDGHLRLLERLSRALRDEMLLRLWKQAAQKGSADEFMDITREFFGE